MKYKAVIMVPKIVAFESQDKYVNVNRQAWALCSNFNLVGTPGEEFAARLLTVISEPENVLVFDPPPMAA